jgi:hypothetical protein
VSRLQNWYPGKNSRRPDFTLQRPVAMIRALAAAERNTRSAARPGSTASPSRPCSENSVSRFPFPVSRCGYRQSLPPLMRLQSQIANRQLAIGNPL